MSEAKIQAHEDFLAERVFQIHNKWPHFRQLLSSIRKLSAETPEGQTVISLERTLLYGGLSLFAPFFPRHDFLSVDCSPSSADARGPYNKALVDDSRCIAIPYSFRARPDAIELGDSIASLIIVPNLVHHVQDQVGLFAEISRLLKPGGRVFIFEPILRELHQVPDDYLRYTPYGMQQMLIKMGFVVEYFETEGGPFQAVTYCWIQALEYFPMPERKKMKKWFYSKHFPRLMEWDGEYKINLERANTCFPISFAMTAHKPE